jgi:hypothetical protein
LVTVSERVCLLPTATLPKLRLVGFDVSVPETAAPVPERGMFNVGFDAVEVSVTVPETAPAAVGANETLNVAVCPAVSVTGAVMPVRLNPEPLLIATWEMVTLDPPVFVTVSERVCLLPTVTVPKLRLVGLEVSAPAAAPVPES